MAWYGSITVQLEGRSPIALATRYGTVEYDLDRFQRDIHGRKIELSRKEFRKFLKLVHRRERDDSYWRDSSCETCGSEVILPRRRRRHRR